jgi:hypothetical protein
MVRDTPGYQVAFRCVIAFKYQMYTMITSTRLEVENAS